MKILSCGAGMQSTALALMSCENKIHGMLKYPKVPVYDAIVFCDLGAEPPWVYLQVEFIKKQCEKCGIPFYILTTNLYTDFINNFGHKRVSSIPFWSVSADGKKAKMKRHCTLDYKILQIQRFVKFDLLGYRKYQRLKTEDMGAHEMHIGFSAEEENRIFDSYNPLFINKFPLVDMKMKRPDSYRYCLEQWGLDTKASACNFCPFHRNYFFQHMKEHYPNEYDRIIVIDELLEKEQPNTAIESKLYLSRSRKRLSDLTPEDYDDAETFDYRGQQVWNGF